MPVTKAGVTYSLEYGGKTRGGLGMKQIIRGRVTGKTTEAIKLSAETGSYIVVANRDQVDIIAKTAKELGISIPYPMTAEEVTRLNGSLRRINRNGVIVDEALYVLQKLLKVKVDAVTISTNEDAIIEHNQKVKVPKFVDQWVEHVRALHWNMQDLLSPESSSSNHSVSIIEWLNDNPSNTEILCKAWLDGYEIEEESWEVRLHFNDKDAAETFAHEFRGEVVKVEKEVPND